MESRLVEGTLTLRAPSGTATLALRDDFIGPAENGDRIYNGAYDNALGSAVVLEVARVLAGLEKRPRRRCCSCS